MKKPRWLLAPALAIGTVAALVACSGSPTPGETPVELNSTLRVALAEVTSNLDPALYNVPANYITIAGAAGYLISHPFKDFPYPDLYDGDMQVVDADTYEPELATDWTLSDDGSTLTMNLREDAMSPYGNPLTAADVVWTAQRNVALATVGNFGMTVANIDKTNPATADGDHTVIWNLIAPSPLLEKILAWSWFAPIDSVEAQKHVTAEDPWAKAWLTENTAFFGPYTVTAFEPGQSATLSLNENWYGDKPDVETIEFTTVPDAGNRQQLVQRGEVDFVPDIPRSQLIPLRDVPEVQVILAPATRYSYLQYRNGVPALDDPLVRQAISYAIPYDTILEDVYQGTALRAQSVGIWIENSFPDSSPFEYDLDKAKELLADSDYPDGFTVNLLYSLSNPGPENEQIAVLIADSLAELGITVNLQKPSSEAAFTTANSAGEFEMVIAGISPGATDSGYAVFVMGNSKGFQNFGKFSNAELDKLTQSALTDTDPAARVEAIEEAMDLYSELVPATPLVNPLVGLVATPNLSNVKLGTWGFPFWKYATLAADESAE